MRWRVGSCGKDGVVVVIHGQHVYACGGEGCLYMHMVGW